MYYEHGKKIPTKLSVIYKLAKILQGLDKDVLFKAVLRQHYERHKERNYQAYMDIVKTGDFSKSQSAMTYVFCRRGKSKYKSERFAKILKKVFEEENCTYSELSDRIYHHEKIKRKYDFRNIHAEMAGKRVPSLRGLVDLATYFGLDPFELFKIVVEDKGIAFARNMMEQWELFKKEADNAKKNIRI